MSDNNNGEKRLPPHITEDDIRLLSGIIGPVFYEQGFNAAWAVDAEGIAQLREALDTALRVEGAWRDRCIEAEAERDALAHQIAAVRALADKHWDWKAGLILAGRLRAILANGACLWRYDDGTEEYQPHEFSDDNGNCCNCHASPSPVTPEGFCTCDGLTNPLRDCGIKAHRDAAHVLRAPQAESDDQP